VNRTLTADEALTKAEKKAAQIRQLRKDHADPAAWAKVEELRSRGWTFPGLSRKLNAPDVRVALTAPYSGSPLRSGLACAIGSNVKELVANAELWESGQMRRKSEFRTADVVPSYVWPDQN
jgi:hypothetical protein